MANSMQNSHFALSRGRALRSMHDPSSRWGCDSLQRQLFQIFGVAKGSSRCAVRRSRALRDSAAFERLISERFIHPRVVSAEAMFDIPAHYVKHPAADHRASDVTMGPRMG
jgi:hypothetical protein